MGWGSPEMGRAEIGFAGDKDSFRGDVVKKRCWDEVQF